MNEGDNHRVGINLSPDKSETSIELTLPEDNKCIFVLECLPFIIYKEGLKKQEKLEVFQK